MISVFLDSSALFAAAYSSTGAARELIKLALRGKVQLIISPDVITETRRNLQRKAPELEPTLNRFLEAVNFTLVDRPSKEAVRSAEAYVVQKDAFIIAAAIEAGADFVVTYDRKHLIDPPEVGRRSGLTIVGPAAVLEELRN